MKLLVVTQYYYPENFVITNICEELVKRGHDVTVLTGLPNYGFGKVLPEYKKIRFEIINGVKINRVKLVAKTKKTISIILNYLSFWFNSKRWVRRCKERFDLVFSMSLSPVTLLASANLYKKKFHVKHVCYCVDLWPESLLATHTTKEGSIFYKILYKWSKKLYEGCDDIIVGSPSFKKYFSDVLDINSDSFHVLVQPPLFVCNNNKKNNQNEKFTILYCGNIGKVQMIEKLPEAVSKIDSSDIIFEIIGNGSKKDEMINEINKFNVSDRINYYGPMKAEEAKYYFEKADCLYVSLKNEGYVGKTIPNKLIMSMAYGKPVLAVLSGDGKELIEKINGGIVCEENFESISKGIKQISTLNKSTLSKMGYNNLSYFKNHFTLSNCVEFLENLFKKNLS